MTVISTANTAREMVRSATTTALRVAARNLELYDTGNVAGADEVFALDVIDHNPATNAASGIDGMRVLIAAVRDGFTDTQHQILFQQELPGGWVVLHWRMTGTHTGDAFGFAASGNRSTSAAPTSSVLLTARSPRSTTSKSCSSSPSRSAPARSRPEGRDLPGPQPPSPGRQPPPRRGALVPGAILRERHTGGHELEAGHRRRPRPHPP
ncbi:ester cyclase [Streptomyces canus]